MRATITRGAAAISYVTGVDLRVKNMKNMMNITTIPASKALRSERSLDFGFLRNIMPRTGNLRRNRYVYVVDITLKLGVAHRP